MLPKTLARHTIRFQKDSFDRAFVMADMLLGLFEIWFAMVLEKSRWVPAGGEQLTDEYTRTNKRGRRAFKAFIDGIYENILAMFAATSAGPSPKAGNTTNARNQPTEGGNHHERESNHQANYGIQQECL